MSPRFDYSERYEDTFYHRSSSRRSESRLPALWTRFGTVDGNNYINGVAAERERGGREGGKERERESSNPGRAASSLPSSLSRVSENIPSNGSGGTSAEA